MKSKLQNRKHSGFTIIEVLIVLAIAGLIMLIVFLAVPALQRNSRNTSVKNDVQNVLGGVAEYSAANNGKIPTNISGTGDVSYTGSSTNTTKISVQGSTIVGITTSDVANVPAGQIRVRLGAKCASDSTSTANARSVAAFYSIETSDALVPQCASS